MNCTTFWDILVEYQEGSLTPAALVSARAHLTECPECSRLAEIISGSRDLLEGDQGILLHRSILQRTSGPACKRAVRELKRQRRGDVDDGTSELLLLHLRACPSCRAAAELSPGGRWHDLRRLFLAPGFDWLAAYAGAVVVFALLAMIPAFRDHVSSFAAAGPVACAARIVPAVEQESRGILGGIFSVVAETEEVAERLQETADSLLSGTQLWVLNRAEEVHAGQQRAWSRIHLVLRDILG